MLEVVDQVQEQNGEKQLLYKTHGTCSQYIEVAVKDGCISKCQFYGGCSGNTQGLSKMVLGQNPAEVITRLEGIQCGSKGTSCPDQLCQALKELQK